MTIRSGLLSTYAVATLVLFIHCEKQLRHCFCFHSRDQKWRRGETGTCLEDGDGVGTEIDGMGTE
jgi:hypothetical protein